MEALQPTPNEKKKEKKPYVKPQVSEVRLVAEQAVLGTCYLGVPTNLCTSNFCVNSPTL